MLRTYIIKYRTDKRTAKVQIEAASKYAAKKMFYHKHPRFEIIEIKEKEEE